MCNFCLINRNNFFFFGFALSVKYNPVEKEQGLNVILENLKKYSKFNLESTVVTQEQKEFFEGLISTISNLIDLSKTLTFRSSSTRWHNRAR